MLRTTVQWRIAEGAQAICRRTASGLAGDLLRGSPVNRISQNEVVRIEFGRGQTLTAKRAIVTAPVGTAPRIEYEPGLPEALECIERELKMEPAVKVSSLLPPGHSVKQRLVLGGSPVGTAWRYRDLVVGFVTPWETGASDTAVLSDLAGAFGVAADDLREPRIMRWSDRPYIPGGDLGFRPGRLTSLGPLLRDDHGLVAFAGAERSSWPNNMEGAISSGVQVGARMAAGLRADERLHGARR